QLRAEAHDQHHRRVVRISEAFVSDVEPRGPDVRGDLDRHRRAGYALATKVPGLCFSPVSPRVLVAGRAEIAPRLHSAYTGRVAPGLLVVWSGDGPRHDRHRLV